MPLRHAKFASESLKAPRIRRINELQATGNSATHHIAAGHACTTMVMSHDDIHQHEEVEESLNIMDKEKELIVKALKKHKGKRKDAASDLGISERTLYRKLKEYDINE